MSLPSQTARTSSSGRSFVYKRRRSRRRSPLAVVAVGGAALALVIVGIVLIGPFGADADEATNEAAGITDPLVSGGGGSGSAGSGALVIEQGRGTGERFSKAGSDGGSDRDSGRASKPVAERRGSPALGVPTEAVAIPDLVPPPLEQGRGMLDEALALDGVASGAGTRTSADRPLERPVDRSGNRAGERAGERVVDRGSISGHLQAADDLIARNDPLAARQALWDAMRMPGLDETQLSVLRVRLTALNSELLFGPVRRAGDPLSSAYTVRSGDALSRIARRENLGTHWKLIQRVNGLSAPEKIRVGQTLKLVPGTFHAVVDKSEFRLDLYHGEPEQPDDWVFIRSIEVGLGEGDSTPIGQFIVRADGKLENPGWVNPRNPAEKFGRDDPDNPIGDFWVGLDGLGDAAAYAGYGLHGTIDPGSIGRERSMGCVRMRSDDIALVYELLTEGRSLVRIRR